MKKILISIVVAVVALFALLVGAVYFLEKQPGAPVADFPAPQGRDEAWRQDLTFLRDEFPQLDRSFTEESSRQFRDILSRVQDQVPSLSDNEIVVEITRAAALSGNGHTRAYLMRNGNYLRWMPIRFYWFSDGLYVVRAIDKYTRTLGARVIAIGTTPPETLMGQMRERIPGSDTWVVYKSTYLLNSPDFLNGLNVVESADSVPVTFESADGDRFTLELSPLQLDDRDGPYEVWRDTSPWSQGYDDGRSWAHVLSEIELPMYLRHPDRSCNHAYLEEEGILYIQINRNDSDGTCSQSDFAREIEELSKSISPRAVVVDLRFNTGGNNATTKEISQGLPVWFGTAEQIYIVTGRATFSAGISTAARLKYYSGERAVIVGEPAAEGLKTWSEGPRFTLPNSKLQIKAATAHHDFAEARFEIGKSYLWDLQIAVAAGDIDVDLPVTLSFQDYLAGRDPVLDVISSQ
jgi:hypothetical protein